MEMFAKTSAELIAELVRLIEDENEEKGVMDVFLNRLNEIVIDTEERNTLVNTFTKGNTVFKARPTISRKSKKHLTQFNTDEFGAKKGSRTHDIHEMIRTGKHTQEDIAITLGITNATVKRCLNKLIKNPKAILIFNCDGTVHGRARK